MEFGLALKQATLNKASREYPASTDGRSRSGTVFPRHRPKFSLKFSSDQTCFTIGSCFARNIEAHLAARNVVLPTISFGVPPEEWPHRPNGLLNEYNAGTISQRILFALEDKEFPQETIVPTANGYADLLLPGGGDVTLERAIERRKQIKTVYESLGKSDVVIITLGLVEAWFDQETGLFINRMPPGAFAQKHPGRFVLKRLDVAECMPLLDKAFSRLTDLGISIVLTVSPVPLQVTFTKADCVVANEFSKAVLRVCAEKLWENPLIDYFPSYEIVRSSGMAGYMEDQLHVKESLVGEITSYMVSVYESGEGASAPS